MIENKRIKIGIISDTHGLLRTEVLDILQSCDCIFHAGDVDRPELLDTIRSLDLDRIVFASRFISCAMKSILRPTPSFSSRIFLIPWMWLRRRTVSSSLQILSEKSIPSAAIQESSNW